MVGNWAAPNTNELEELYLDTCQASCGLVKSEEQAQECREKFCPNYSNYLMTGVPLADASPSLASNEGKEVREFCATWMLHLINELGWHRRIRLNLKECICAAGKDCLVK